MGAHPHAFRQLCFPHTAGQSREGNPPGPRPTASSHSRRIPCPGSRVASSGPVPCPERCVCVCDSSTTKRSRLIHPRPPRPQSTSTPRSIAPELDTITNFPPLGSFFSAAIPHILFPSRVRSYSLPTCPRISSSKPPFFPLGYPFFFPSPFPSPSPPLPIILPTTQVCAFL